MNFSSVIKRAIGPVVSHVAQQVVMLYWLIPTAKRAQTVMLVPLSDPGVLVQKRTTSPQGRASSVGKRDIGVVVSTLAFSYICCANDWHMSACPNGDGALPAPTTSTSRGSKRGRGSTRARGHKSMSKRGGKTKKNTFGAPDE